MRFHHSTRRGRNASSRHQQSASRSGQASSSAARWAQLSYCRQTNIYFNRRIAIEPPSQGTNSIAFSELKPRLGSTASISATQLEPFDYGDPNEYQVSSGQSIQGQRQQPDSPIDHSQFGRLSLLEDSDNNSTVVSKQQQPPIGGQEMMSLAGVGEQLQAAERAPKRLPRPESRLDSDDDQLKREGEVLHHSKQQAKKRHKQQQLPDGGPSGRLKSPNKPQVANGVAASSANKTPVNGQKQQPSGKLSLELAREKLIAQVEKHPFWSNKAAKRMRLTQLEERRVFIYELNSFCERRELEWRYEPYRGGLVTGSTPSRRAANQPALGSPCGSLGAPLPGQQPAEAPLGPICVPCDADGAHGCHLKSRSQPATPPIGLAPAHQAAKQSRFQRAANCHQPPHSVSISRLQVPPSPSSSLPPTIDGLNEPARQFEFIGTQQTASSATTNNNQPSGGCNKSPIRRSCSSAASTPIRQLDTTATNRQLTITSGADQLMPSSAFVWSIEPETKYRPSPFKGSVHFCEIPDASFVKRCHGCQGRGRLKCTSCHGVGYEVCISCSGKGTLRALAGPMTTANASSSSAGSRGASRGGGGGGAADSSLHSSHPGSPFGGMWDSAAADYGCSSSSRRRDGEPGGITGAGSSQSGAWLSESCHFCHGAGQKRCWICAGRAYISCLACAGTGQLRCYLGLNITWLNHRDECVLNNFGIHSNATELQQQQQQQQPLVPRERLKLSSGLVLVEEESTNKWLQPVECLNRATTSLVHRATGGAANVARSPPLEGGRHSVSSPTKGLAPLCSAHEADQLRLASSRLIERHQDQFFKHEKLIKQRHRVTQVDCSIISWEWKRRHGHFVIYGCEGKVYIAKYPFKSICNIT